MNVGPKIRKIRELRGFKQDYVAKQLGMTQSNYSKMEKQKDKENIPFEMLERVAKVLDVDPLDILNFDEKFVFNIQEQKGSNSNGLIINNFSEKIQAMYEARIKGLEEEVAFLRAMLGKNGQ
jgi:transcriptional regulator with XRE-family HTH domain